MQPHIRNWCAGYCDIWKDRSENVVLLCGYKYSGGLSRFLLDLCRASWSWCPAQRTRKLRKERILKCWWVPRYDKACLLKVKILVTKQKFWPLFVRSLFRSDHFHPWSALRSMRSHLPRTRKTSKRADYSIPLLGSGTTCMCGNVLWSENLNSVLLFIVETFSLKT